MIKFESILYNISKGTNDEVKIKAFLRNILSSYEFVDFNNNLKYVENLKEIDSLKEKQIPANCVRVIF